MAARHGTRACYNGGCRCDKCKLAEANYQKARRHGVTALPNAERAPVEQPEVREPGPTEASVLAELATLPAAETHPSLAQGALAMARILDNPLHVAQQPQALARMAEMMKELRKGVKKGGRLAAVRSMTRPESATG